MMAYNVRIGKYLYCIVNTSERPLALTQPGLGRHKQPVYPIRANGLMALVSDSPLVNYERSRRNMMAHAKVLEEVMRQTTLLPIRFGTLAPNENVVRDKLLTRRHDELCGLLADINGQIEMGLKAIWAEQAIFEQIMADYDDIRHLRDDLMGRPPAETHYERIRLGQMIEAAMIEKREQDAAIILEQLQPLVNRYRLNQPGSDRMVLNAAFLLDQKDERTFATAIRHLKERLGERMMFKYVGPVPPYNFVNLDIRWTDWQDID